MNFSWLTLRDLQYLVAVAQLEHFGRAAEACNVSQPGLSAQIKKIEEQLGVSLFERTNRRMSITKIGKRVVEQAQVVLEEAEKIITLARQDSKPLAGNFRLGAIATVGPYFLPRVLGPLKKAFPELDLHLREGLTDPLLEDLRSGRLDAVLASRTFNERGFKVYPLFTEPLLLMLPKGHRLTTKKPLRIADLNAAEMTLLEDGHCLRDETIETCPQNRRGNIQEFHATSLETLRYLVANGAGYTLMPALAAQKDPDGLVIYRPIDTKQVSRTVVLVCRNRFTRKADVEALADFIRRNLPKTGSPDAALTPLLNGE